jgi:hypothetical protein
MTIYTKEDLTEIEAQNLETAVDSLNYVENQV